MSMYDKNHYNIKNNNNKIQSKEKKESFQFWHGKF